MNKNDEMAIELAKYKADKVIITQELNKAKENFISELNNGLGEEIKNSNKNLINEPIKIHKPFKVIINEFFQRLNKII